MTPELSRRVARALQVANPDLEFRVRVVRACEKAENFGDLPSWLQAFLGKTENKQAGARRIEIKKRAFNESLINRDGDGQFADKPGGPGGKEPQAVAAGAKVEFTPKFGATRKGTVRSVEGDRALVAFPGDKKPVSLPIGGLTVLGSSPARSSPKPKPQAPEAPSPAPRAAAKPAPRPKPETPSSALQHPSSGRGYRDTLPESNLGKGEDRQAVYDYAWDGKSYVEMNGALRTGKPPNEETQKSIDNLTGVLAKHRLPHPVMVHRGVENSAENRKYFHDNVGKVVRDNGFVSSSLDRQAAEDFAEVFNDGEGNGIVIQMRVPAGAQGVYVGGQFDAIGGYDQQEVLLQRGGQYRISSVKKQDGWIVVDMVMEGQLDAKG